jgi:hypothetical protein
MAAIAPGESSLEIDPVTGFSVLSTTPGLPTSRRRSTAMMGYS